MPVNIKIKITQNAEGTCNILLIGAFEDPVTKREWNEGMRIREMINADVIIEQVTAPMPEHIK